MLMTERLVLRPLTSDDVPELLQLLRANRTFLKPWSPRSDESQLTTGFLQEEMARRANEWSQDRAYGFGIFTLDDGRLIGRINISQVVRGAFQNCFVGYWLDEGHNGQKLMQEALAAVVAFAFDELKLHRIEATTLVHNVASQRVLTAVGFRNEGEALHYLQIDGHWQDHKRFAITFEDWANRA